MRRRELLLAGLLFGCGPAPFTPEAAPRRAMNQVNHDGVKLAVQTFGSPEDQPLVMIMGATASMLGWPDELCVALASRDLFVLRFDHRDTGASTSVPLGEAKYAVEDMASDVLAVMEDHDLSTAHLMGMSLGGYIAQTLALSAPERVRSLILIAAEPLGWDGTPLPHISDAFMAHFGKLEVLDWTDKAAVIDFLLEIERLSAGSAYPFDENRVRHRIGEVLARADQPASMFNHSTVETRENWTGLFRKIQQPVLVIHGEEDPVLPIENGRAIVNGVANGELLVLPGVGHELPIPLSAQIAEAVAAHVRSVVATRL